MSKRAAIIAKRGYSPTMSASDLSLKISSYPISARYLANRLSSKGKSIAELCCGVGVSLIEFSNHFERVIGIDNDPDVARDARKNIEQAGIRNCEVREADVAAQEMMKSIRVDVVAYDVPYWSDHGETLLRKNPDMMHIISTIRKYVTLNIVMYTPPHITYEEIMRLFDECEYQEVWINGVHDRNFIYFGSLAEYFGRTKINLQN